jgi:hypothetical protein
MKTVGLFHHSHHTNSLPISNRHGNSSHLPIPPQPIKRHSGQRTPHLKTTKTHRNRCTLGSIQNQAPQPLSRKLRMHKDRTNLRRIYLRIKLLRFDRLNLMIPAIQRLPKTPPATPSQLTAAFIEGNKISPICNQPAVHRKHRSQRPIDLRGRIIPCLQATHRSINQSLNSCHIFHRGNSQIKLCHSPSIKVARPIPSLCKNPPRHLVRATRPVLDSSP